MEPLFAQLTSPLWNQYWLTWIEWLCAIQSYRMCRGWNPEPSGTTGRLYPGRTTTNSTDYPSSRDDTISEKGPFPHPRTSDLRGAGNVTLWTNKTILWSDIIFPVNNAICVLDIDSIVVFISCRSQALCWRCQGHRIGHGINVYATVPLKVLYSTLNKVEKLTLYTYLCERLDPPTERRRYNSKQELQELEFQYPVCSCMAQTNTTPGVHGMVRVSLTFIHRNALQHWLQKDSYKTGNKQ